MKVWIFAAMLGALAACSPRETAPSEQNAASGEGTAAAADAASTEPAGPEAGTLDWAVAGAWRSEEEKARDVWRNPSETLNFFGVDPAGTVVEIWPGGGWYTQILAPWVKENGGRYIAAGFDPEGSDFARDAMARFQETYVADPETYGAIEVTTFSRDGASFAPDGSADAVLSFRNVHNWMAGGYEVAFFRQAYKALKPGGVLGIVEHRLPSGEPQDPEARSGYVHEDYVVALARNAGFELVERSDINANPADTADHPFGVWTLPPSSRTESRDGETPADFDPETYLAIGESDRMTLKFVKPAETADAG